MNNNATLLPRVSQYAALYYPHDVKILLDSGEKRILRAADLDRDDYKLILRGFDNLTMDEGEHLNDIWNMLGDTPEGSARENADQTFFLYSRLIDVHNLALIGLAVIDNK